MSNEEIFQTMKDLVAEQFAMEPEEVTMETSFEEDLGADSVDLVELVMAMEEEFEIGQTQEEEMCIRDSPGAGSAAAGPRPGASQPDPGGLPAAGPSAADHPGCCLSCPAAEYLRPAGFALRSGAPAGDG